MIFHIHKKNINCCVMRIIYLGKNIDFRKYIFVIKYKNLFREIRKIVEIFLEGQHFTNFPHFD